MNHSLTIGDITVKYPIIQGGMGVGISKAGLASATANNGGIGVISAAGLGMFDQASDPYKAMASALKKEINKARTLTNGVIGVNIMTAMQNFSSMVKTAFDANIDMLFVGSGLPLDLPAHQPVNNKTKLIPIVSSFRAAKLIVKKWWSRYKKAPDALVLEGPQAGGHLGFKHEEIDHPDYQLEPLLKTMVNNIGSLETFVGKPIPIIAAGGIYTGQDVRRMLALGASGVQMGSRFVTTDECDASETFKRAYIDSVPEDIGIIESPVGLPGRAIINPFLKQVAMGEKHPVHCPFDCIHTCEKENAPYCISLALENARKGRLKNGFAFAGTNAHRASEIISVKALFESLKREWHDVKNEIV